MLGLAGFRALRVEASEGFRITILHPTFKRPKQRSKIGSANTHAVRAMSYVLSLVFNTVAQVRGFGSQSQNPQGLLETHFASTYSQVPPCTRSWDACFHVWAMASDVGHTMSLSS